MKKKWYFATDFSKDGRQIGCRGRKWSCLLQAAEGTRQENADAGPGCFSMAPLKHTYHKEKNQRYQTKNISGGFWRDKFPLDV